MTDQPDRRSAAQARADVEARRAQDRAALDAAFADRFGDGRPGRSLVVLDAASTALVTATALLAVLQPRPFELVYLTASLVAFVGGMLLFLLAMIRAAQRSRTDAIGIGGLFFLAGSAPKWARQQLLGLLAAQVVVTITAAAVRPFTVLAFGTLVPLLGLGFCGWWSARFGVFGPRDSGDRRPGT
ncbi:MAG: hypothetical protein ACKOYM_11810 [Actinomycetes bacterium]